MTNFTIRHLLIVITLAAICSLLIRTDWLAAVWFAVAAIYWTVALQLFKTLAARRVNLAMRCIALLPAVVILWFSVIDSSISLEWCVQCPDHRYIRELRVCGIPVWTTRYEFHDNQVSRFRKDLGFPCTHKLNRLHARRAWGLLWRARPCMNITCCLSGDPDFYTDAASEQVRQFAIENPSEAAALYKTIVNDENYGAMVDFVIDMKELTSEQ